ncbi:MULTISPECIES: hypothetical protein [Streptococcus]|uniref:hypothetical protein n=1 Tax=Streptococcus TaxID=1301 RepID=UPI00076FC21A|nr:MULTISPECIES: hypothetical protein [Streptococcus]KXI12082.1 hypothetical protein HMPREF3205_01503 [Streptococcus pasteurianus]MDU7847502.1 hypothetical protein [Streptococcus sp.]
MAYLTETEFTQLGFDDVENFDKLAKRAEIAINLYTQGIYQRYIKFEEDFDYRQQAVKLAMAFQIAYLDISGIMTADDKKTMQSVSIGRTSINYGSSVGGSDGQQYNLSLDAENVLKQAGFSLVMGVDYDR